MSSSPLATRHSPLVSVVTSVYNDADRVARAVDSIIAQTFRDWEFIIIDDGSTDGTARVLDAIAAAEPRIRIIHQENTGLTRALILGCEQAAGRYIARQDADDWSHPERLAEQVALLEHDDRIGFVSCWAQYVGPAGESLELLRRPEDPELATQQLLNQRQGPPAHGSVMFRKQLYEQVGGYRPEFYFGQDSDLWLRLAECCLIGYAPRVLYTWRREMKSISGALRDLQKQFGSFGQSCRAARRDGQSEQPILEQAATLTQQIIANRLGGSHSPRNGSEMAYLIGSQLVRNGDDRASGYLWQVVRQRPWHWRAWVRLGQAAFSGKQRAASHEKRQR